MKGLGIKKPSLKICIAEPLALPGAGLQTPMLLINWRGKLGSVKDNAKIIKIMYVTHVSEILKKGLKKKFPTVTALLLYREKGSQKIDYVPQA